MLSSREIRELGYPYNVLYDISLEQKPSMMLLLLGAEGVLEKYPEYVDDSGVFRTNDFTMEDVLTPPVPEKLSEDLDKTLNKWLKEKDREMVILRYKDELPYRRIGERLGIDESKVKWKMSDALYALNSKLVWKEQKDLRDLVKKKVMDEIDAVYTTLKPCPFCGVKPQIRYKGNGIHCNRCGFDFKKDIELTNVESVQLVTKAWNKRKEAKS